MKNGIVIETNAEYHGYKEAISKSRLARMSVCPSYFKWHEDNPQPPSDDMIEGSAFHKLVLEPDTFDKEFIVAPKFDRRTKEGKLAYNNFCELVQSGISVITEEQYDMIQGMRESILRNPYARKLINGNIEQSMYFVDDMTGVRCKVRPDVWRRVGDRVAIIDLKSTRSALPNNFARDVVKFNYDLQTYMYCYGVSKVLGVPMENIDFVFIAVEKKLPYLVNVMQADNYVLQKGEADFREYIGTYQECLDTSNWYGLNGSYDVINNLTLPSYLLKDILVNE
jgi:exodeoxyribonuclease VIII